MDYLYSKLTSEIINAFYHVYNVLGVGFLEKVYERALSIELEKRGLRCICQKGIDVFYDEELIGQFYADIMVEDKVIIELKAVEYVLPIHETQLVNYLKASEIEVGLLLNFGKDPKPVRKVMTKKFKQRPK